MTLRVRLFFLVLAALTPLLVTQIYDQVALRQERRQEVQRSALREAELINAELGRVAAGMENFLLATAGSAQSRPGAPDCSTFVGQLIEKIPGAMAIGAADTSGDIYCSTRSFVPGTLGASDRVDFKRAQETGALTIGAYRIIPPSGRPAFTFAYPLPNDGDGKKQGVVFVVLALDVLSDYLARISLPAGYSLTVADRNGIILASLPERSYIGQSVPADWKSRVARTATTLPSVHDSPGSAHPVMGLMAAPGTLDGITLSVGIAQDAALTFADRALTRALVMAGLATLTALLLAWVIARQTIERPMQSLLDAAKRWRSGDYGARSMLRGSPTEMSRLAAAFDSMAESLQLREADRASSDLALRRSRDAALSANQSKTRFLAAASHDLRQPLHALSLAVAVMQARHLDDADTAHIERIGRSVRSLSNLLNTLLDVSQLDAGLVKPNITNFGVSTLFDEIGEQFKIVAAQKNIQLHVAHSTLALRSDRQLLGRMINNLVSNAIKYTPQGGSVRIHAYDDGEYVILVVADSGIGIAADLQEEIFTDFTQLNNPERDRNKGLGLGLAIVRRMGELLVHPVTLQSEPGAGSTFSVQVPRSTDHFDDSRSEPIRYHYDGRILLVEDDPLVAEATAELLKVWGAQVTTVHSGEAALALMEEEAAHFDAVIADYRLPLMTGAHVVKAAMARWPAIRAVVVTGNAVEGILREIQLLGAALLQKPIRTAALVDILRRR